MPNRFVIKDCKIMSEYGIDIATNNTDCHICRNSLNEPSIIYMGKEGKISKVVEGSCGHYFHKECIENWCKTSTTCPLCGTNDWISKKKN